MDLLSLYEAYKKQNREEALNEFMGLPQRQKNPLTPTENLLAGPVVNLGDMAVSALHGLSAVMPEGSVGASVMPKVTSLADQAAETLWGRGRTTDPTQMTLQGAFMDYAPALGSSSAVPGMANVWRSKMHDVISEKMRGPMPADQLEKTLLGAGVKPEEIEWTGLGNVLSEARAANRKVGLSEIPGPMQLEETWKRSEQRPLSREQFDSLPVGEQDRLANSADRTKFSQWQLSGGDNYRELLLRMPESNYRVGHWDEPGVLAHVRMNDRVTDGKPTLFLEEIQSNWHQLGRKQGYRTPEVEARKRVAAEALSRGEPNVDLRDADLGYGVPDAPFKKTWPEMAFKRALQEAVDNGQDRIAWTTGKQQAERYDLSKQVDAVRIGGDPDQGLVVSAARPGEGFDVIASDVPLGKLEEYVGKDIAKKYAETGQTEFRGLDLKVGGEGMKGFYDKMLVDTMNKLGKPYGARVGKTRITTVQKRTGEEQSRLWNTPEEATAHREGRELTEEVHYIDIPPAWKEAIKKGVPLFSAGAAAAGLSGESQAEETSLLERANAAWEKWHPTESERLSPPSGEPVKQGLPPGWSIEDEAAFQSWYGRYADQLGLSKNPDDPLHFYDYRSAWKAGERPDTAGHMDGAYKGLGHPTEYKNRQLHEPPINSMAPEYSLDPYAGTPQLTRPFDLQSQMDWAFLTREGDRAMAQGMYPTMISTLVGAMGGFRSRAPKVLNPNPAIPYQPMPSIKERAETEPISPPEEFAAKQIVRERLQREMEKPKYYGKGPPLSDLDYWVAELVQRRNQIGEPRGKKENFNLHDLRAIAQEMGLERKEK